MKLKLVLVLSSLLLSSASIAAPVTNNTQMSEQDRLARLERLVNGKGLVNIMVRVESMQGDLQRLLGELEVQKHTLEEIKKRQRDLYLDIDRRLLQIERRTSAAVAPPLLGNVTNVPSQTQVPVIKSTASVVVATKKALPIVSTPQKKTGEKAAYQKAFDLMYALRYDKATQAFRQFLIYYPNGIYAHIAQYWLAETSYATRNYNVAVQDYQTLIDKYPKSPKRADALLKIAYSQYELKDFVKSKIVLEKLILAYPGTTEAGQAQNLLQKIRLKKIQ